MDSFEIEFKRSAEKDLRRITSSSVREILERIEALTENPFPRQSQKLKGTQATYRLRAGEYRAIYQVDVGAKTIMIYYIRHRKDVYRRIE